MSPAPDRSNPLGVMARAPDKRQTLLQFLERGVTMVHLDARKSGVVVPPQYAQEPHLDRLTLTPFPIVTARMVALLVTSGKKAGVLEQAVRGKEDLVACPAQWLRHAVGRVAVIATREAAARISATG